ncbi:unnamed protein product [Pleuronectes platessa]|uniref:Uncharacterized protein n=1 Tax=Pleuronectes platessa TaxID=8262 RepID=A0A9N7Y5T5_PLEPL|nr:unnamed protein product [Pleuronectes platessa]
MAAETPAVRPDLTRYRAQGPGVWDPAGFAEDLLLQNFTCFESHGCISGIELFKLIFNVLGFDETLIDHRSSRDLSLWTSHRRFLLSEQKAELMARFYQVTSIGPVLGTEGKESGLTPAQSPRFISSSPLILPSLPPSLPPSFALSLSFWGRGERELFTTNQPTQQTTSGPGAAELVEEKRRLATIEPEAERKTWETKDDRMNTEPMSMRGGGGSGLDPRETGRQLH